MTHAARASNKPLERPGFKTSGPKQPASAGRSAANRSADNEQLSMIMSCYFA